jgi:pimeloyl-ACP methyl ester carboxylesterase
MKQTITFLVLTFLALTSCNEKGKNTTHIKMGTTTDTLDFKSGYSDVNGLKMYYEIYGHGKLLVLIHGGGSTIQSSFEKVIPLFAKNRKVLAVELQAHGRTSDRNNDLTFEQDADDIATLLKNLKIDKADFFGFSNGGTTTLQIAIRHPEIVDKIILGSALSKRNGVPEQFWGFMKQAKLENMPEQLREAYKKVSPDPNGLQVMFAKDAKRMVDFKDIPDEKMKSIKVPAFIIIGDKDIITPEHAIEMHRLITNSDLAIIPGAHGEYIGEITTLKPDSKESDLVVPMIERFLDKKESSMPAGKSSNK